MKYIYQFCQKHKLKPLFFSTNYQLLSSSNCGQLSCALMAVINKRRSLIKLFKFRKTLLNNTVEKNEQYLLSLLKNHFKLHWFRFTKMDDRSKKLAFILCMFLAMIILIACSISNSRNNSTIDTSVKICIFLCVA